MVATYTDTNLRSPIYNIMTLSIFKSLLDVEEDEFYMVDPEFQGNSVVVTDENGDITEGALGNNVFIANGKLQCDSYYGTCATAASTQIEVVDCPDFVLRTGASLTVKFTNSQTYNGQPKLNVNNTGAIGVCRYGTTAAPRYTWYAGEIMNFVYDGTNWIMPDMYPATTSYLGPTTLLNSGTSTSTAYALVPASLNAVEQNIITGVAIYSTSTSYNVGDYCRYGGATPFLYKCNTPIVADSSNTHAWNAAEWDVQPDLLSMILAIQSQPTTSVITDASTITLAANTVYTAGTLTSFTITLPSTPDATFNSEINFTSGATATSITYSEPIKWLDGSDSIIYVSGVPVFTPVANTRYNVWIWYDGAQWNGSAKAV